MANTPNYNFTLIDGNNAVNLVNDINTPLTQIDTALKEVADASGGSVPTNHASAQTTYGAGSATLYGHVKISDSGTAAAESGTAASPKYVNTVQTSLQGQITELETELESLKAQVAKFAKGTTYNEIATNGFVYQKNA